MPHDKKAVACDEASADVVLPLPQLPPEQQGVSSAKADNYTAEVSNASGYMCHIHVEARFPVPPDVIFGIFTHPDNAGVFRDIKGIGYRHVVEDLPRFRRVQVEQCGELKVLWMRRQFSSHLIVEEDARDPACLRTTFTLVKSDVLSRFGGSWELRPVYADGKEGGQVVGTAALLQQDVLPKGVPPFFAQLPLLGGLLRGVSLTAVKRLVEDVNEIVAKVKAAGGLSALDTVLLQMARKRGHAARSGTEWGGASQPPVASFALGDMSESSESSLAAGDDDDAAQDGGRAAAAAAAQAAGREVSAGGAGGSSLEGGVAAVGLTALAPVPVTCATGTG